MQPDGASESTGPRVGSGQGVAALRCNQGSATISIKEMEKWDEIIFILLFMRCMCVSGPANIERQQQQVPDDNDKYFTAIKL